MVAVAMDAQGFDRARPFVKKAGIEFPAVVDRKGDLWKHLDFNVVPLQFFFDESGRLIYSSSGGPKGEVLERLDRALAAPAADATARAAVAMAGEAAPSLFAQGVAAFDAGELEKARELWRQALTAEPDNWLIRKQIWALDDPSRFYEGDIDYAWQKERIQEGS
jgi:tetratricopeptide (TPR) repeat protein